MGLGANYASWAGSGDEMPAPDLEVADTTYEPGRLAEWTGFHAQVEALPEEEREVFDLLFYQGLPQAEAAAVLGVSWSSGDTIPVEFRDTIPDSNKFNDSIGG